MNAPAQTDRQAFLARVQESGLLSDVRMAPVLRGLSPDAPARVVAQALVEAGLLTRFQAGHLLAGHVRGFFLGPYRILEQIGQGGMGRVYKARHRVLGRVVAVKVLAPGVVDTEGGRELFDRERRAVARLVHPNIVTAYDAGEQDSRHYLALEYVDGPNLDQLVRRRGPLPVGQACDFIRQAAQGLQCAHEAGMVHRDIKPANLLVQSRGPDRPAPGIIKISDFGLARLHPPGEAASGATGTIAPEADAVMGTPDYISPEQARCLHRVDIRSDLYSLGCTLYYLLAGRPPFPGGTALEKLIRHSADPAEPLSRLRPELPQAVVAVVERLMAKRPDDRFQTPAELAEALRPFGAGAGTPWSSGDSFRGKGRAPAEASGPASLNVLDGGASSAEMSALTGPLLSDASPTLPSPQRPLVVSRVGPSRPGREQAERVGLAVLGAVVIVGVLLAAGLLALLLS
jgi:serine/threonine-protein kinase